MAKLGRTLLHRLIYWLDLCGLLMDANKEVVEANTFSTLQDSRRRWQRGWFLVASGKGGLYLSIYIRYPLAA